MALQIWMPLNGNIDNQGLSNIDTVNLNATSSTAGKIGSCYYFNGSSARIYANNVDLPNLEMSCCCWAKFESLDNNNYPYLISLGDGGTGVTQQIGIFVYKSDKKVTICGNGTEMKTSYVVTTNVWYHFCMIYTGTVSKLYINGNEVYSGASAGAPTKRSGFCIGARASSASGAGAGITYPMKGWMNDVRVYDHALSPREVKEIAKGLVLHYPLSMPGQENLLKNSHHKCDNNSYYVGTYAFADSSKLVTGKTYTLSFNGELQDDSQTGWYFNIFPSPYTMIVSESTAKEGRFAFSFVMPENGGNRTSIGCYSLPLGNRKGCAIWDVKLEEGDRVTPWTPNSSDALYSQIGLDNNIEYDVSGYGHNGTKVGTITYSGDTPRYQISTSFNGTDNGILIENLPLSNIINTAVTYSFWIKPSGENGGRSVYFGSYSSISWSIEKTTGNVIRGYWNGSPDVTYSGATITDNVWQHVCITKNGTSDVKVYINGVLKATSTATHSALTFPTTYRIGRDTRSGDGTPYKGLMSDFRIYATVLSADDVLELYQVGASLANNGVLMAHEFIE